MTKFKESYVETTPQIKYNNQLLKFRANSIASFNYE